MSVISKHPEVMTSLNKLVPRMDATLVQSLESCSSLEEALSKLVSTDILMKRCAIRELGSKLKSSENWSNDVEMVVNILVEFYLTSPSKSNLKPFALSFLDSVNNQKLSSEVVRVIKFNLARRMKLTYDILSVRPLVDSISRFMDCKNIGWTILSECLNDIFCFLMKSAHLAHAVSNHSEDSVTFNDTMASMKIIIHATNKLLQKMILELRESDSVVMSLNSLVDVCIKVLKQENAILDCQTSCAMSLPLVYSVFHHEASVTILWRDIFETNKYELETDDARTQLCLLTGLVGGLSCDDLSVLVDGNSILKCAAAKVFQVSNDKGDTSIKFALSRCLVVLTSKLVAALYEDTDGELHQKLLQYVYDHIEDPVDGIRYQAKIVFENLIEIHVRDQGEDKYAVLNSLVNDLLLMSWHCKAKYGLLSILTSYLSSSVFLTLCPDMAKNMLSALDEICMANYVSDLYHKLMVKHKLEVSTDVFHEVWLEPVISALSNSSLRTGMIEYILPVVLQTTTAGLKYIVPKIIQSDVAVSDSFLVLVTCLKRARCLGYVKQTPDDHNKLWNAIIPKEILLLALQHGDECVRIEAFGLLCFNPKTTEIIPEFDLNLIHKFISENLTSQSPATRQQIASALKKLLIRLKESLAALVKKKITDSNFVYSEFVRRLYEMLLRNLYCGVSFTRRTTCLNILVVIDDVLNKVDELPSFDSCVTSDFAENLLQLFADTFEENKSSALDLLLKIDREKLKLTTEARTREILDTCAELVSTTRPQDCTTAAFLYKLVLQQPLLLKVMNSSAIDTAENRYFSILNNLLDIFKSQVVTAEEDLIRASIHAPMYPSIHCIRYIFNLVDVSTLEETNAWHALLEEMVNVCFQACAVVSPVVSHASPEGNVPVQDLITDSDDASLSTVQDMPEFLVVCSWRTVKEVSLLLGLITQVPLPSDSAEGLLSLELLLKIGQFFTDLLLESRHRGAFELAYAGFQPMCGVLWNSKSDYLNKLPLLWIGQILEDIKNSDSETSRLCATRRSAGVPFYMLALVVTEPSSRGRKCLKSVMGSLLEFSSMNGSLVQIHAMNVMRAIIKDNRLGENVQIYVADGVRVTTLCFSSANWTVRNAATLLFSTLMIRIFGVRRDRNGLSNKNSLSGRVFFYRYPALFPFLLEQINQCTENIETLNPGLYAILTILGRLTPSILEGTDSSLNIADFIPFVMRCAASPVLKTRQLGARALCPIVFKDQLESILERLLGYLECIPGQNCLHGVLLQLHYLLQDILFRNITVSGTILKRLYRLNWLSTRANPCYVTRSAYLNCVHCCFPLFLESDFQVKVLKEFLVTIHLEVASCVPLNRIGYVQFMVDLVKLYLDNCADFDNGRLLKFLLNHRMYEIRELSLKFLLKSRNYVQVELLQKRLENETNQTCLAVLLEILAEESTLEVAVPQSKRHEVSCARLRCLAAQTETNYDDLIDELLLTHQMDQVSELRLASAHALRRILENSNKISTKCWAICLALLLDDDEEIRDVASKIIAEILDSNAEERNLSLSYSVALSKCIELFIRNNSLCDVLDQLISWICGSGKLETSEGRLFDKGEQSTYEDHIHLVLKICGEFKKALTTIDEDILSLDSRKYVIEKYSIFSKALFENLKADPPNATMSERFVQTATYNERFETNVKNFGVVYILHLTCHWFHIEIQDDFHQILEKVSSLYKCSSVPWPFTYFTKYFENNS